MWGTFPINRQRNTDVTSLPILAAHAPTLKEIEQARSIAPDINALAHYLMYVLTRVNRNLELAINRNMDSYGLTTGRYLVIEIAYRAGEKGIASSALAETLGVKRATITGLLDNLEKDGLIERVRRTQDKRRIDIRATQKAEDYLKSILPDHCSRVDQTFSNFTEKELHDATQFMFKLDSRLSFLVR